MIQQWLAPVKKLGVRGPGGPQMCLWRLKLFMYHESRLCLVQVEQPRPFPVPRPHIPPYDALRRSHCTAAGFVLKPKSLSFAHGLMETT